MHSIDWVFYGGFALFCEVFFTCRVNLSPTSIVSWALTYRFFLGGFSRNATKWSPPLHITNGNLLFRVTVNLTCRQRFVTAAKYLDLLCR